MAHHRETSNQRFTDHNLTTFTQKLFTEMSKILAVFGATGQQGSSVVNYVLNDPELSQQYKIRAITRDVNSDKAKKLKKKVEVVQGDLLDRASLEAALIGVNTIYLMTVPSFGPDAVEAEFQSAKIVADIALEKCVEYIVFSTLPSVSEMTSGKYTNLTPFDAKAKAEQYIQGLSIKSAFCSLGSFMENLQAQSFLAPQPSPDGSNWILSRPVSSEAKLPLLDAVGDTGKFVGAILAEPNKYEGKTFCAATKLYTYEEIVAALSKNTGKPVVFRQISFEDFRKTLPFAEDVWMDGLHVQEEYGYFGPDSEKLVSWAAENARGNLSTLKEYLDTHPFQLA
jgi:uncharacterized protein YbjT (DUF2867 family)